MAMMSEDEEKTVIHALFQDNKFPFAYDMRDNVTNPSELSRLKYDLDAFKLDIKVVVAMQIHVKNFKYEGDKAGSFRFLFWVVEIYKIEAVKFLVVSTSEKRQKEEDKWLAIPPCTKKTL